VGADLVEVPHVATGKRVWLKYTVPAPGEPGSETWKDANNAWQTGGAAVWVTGTYDVETNQTIWGTGNPVVTWWAAEGQDVARAQRAVRLGGLDVFAREHPFAAVIRCTADPTKADKRTRSKWSRVMRCSAAYKPESKPLDWFIKGKGGINACAARFSRRLGRDAAKRSKRRRRGDDK
jgi:hypothetical protein